MYAGAVLPRLAGLALLGLSLSWSAPARADLAGDVERLVRAWSDRGARVERLPPVFLERGRARTLLVAPPREGDAGCTTVAAIGVRTTDFFMTREAAGAADDDATPSARKRSAGGTAVVSACGADRTKLDRLRVEMASPRATIELVTVRSADRPRELRQILPERATGPLAPRGDPGGPMVPRPLAERVLRAAQRARTDGAVDVERVAPRSIASGDGRIELELAPGCHRLEVLADPGPGRAVDVDAEARDAGGKVLARDRSELPDARLDFCLGEITNISVVFSGAPGSAPVVVSRARWPIPARVPSRWGPRARAAFASTLRLRRAPDPPETATIEAIGVQGTTTIPIEVQPGRCYLAALAMARGDARMLRLSVAMGDHTARDDNAKQPEAVSASFCADEETTARLDVDARGGSVFWALAVWPMGALAP